MTYVSICRIVNKAAEKKTHFRLHLHLLWFPHLQYYAPPPAELHSILRYFCAMYDSNE